MSSFAPTGGFDPTSFEALAALEERSFWFRGRNQLLLWALGRHFADAESLLEIGCGTGFVLQALHDHRPRLALTGTDLYEEGLRFARERLPEVDLFRLDATKMDYTERWDVVGAFDVLEHIEDDRTALAGMHQAVRYGGGVLVTVPQHDWLWSRADDYAHHVRRYSRAELAGKMRAAGFTVERMTSFVTVLLPVMYASRLRQRRDGTPYDPRAEHAAAARLPGLEATLTAELELIRRGVDLPLGGSLLAMGRRR